MLQWKKVVVSVAAGNDGPSNDGLSGMGSSDLSITVGATDDGNTLLEMTIPLPLTHPVALEEIMVMAIPSTN